MRNPVVIFLLSAAFLSQGGLASAGNKPQQLPASVLKKTRLADGPLADGLAALRANQPDKANLIFNRSLKSDPRNPLLNFLNAFSYEMSSAGAGERQDLARVGYKLTLQFDPYFWPAAVQLGNLALAEGNTAEAQLRFAKAAIIAPDKSEPFYGLAAASYAAADLPSAIAALDRAVAIDPPQTPDRARVAAMIRAATGDARNAELMVAWLKSHGDATTANFTANRVGALNRNYLQLASFDGGPPRLPTLIGPTAVASNPSNPSRAALHVAQTLPKPSAQAARPPAPLNPQLVAQQSHMANIDVVIIQRDETTSSARGVNLLTGLAVQFGNNLINTAYGKTTNDGPSGTFTNIATSFGRGVSLSIPGVAYSLNIANSTDGHSQIQARPTLLVYDGQTSKFFNGAEVTYAINGSLSAASAAKLVGLSLDVTPTFGPDGIVTLKVRTGVSDFYNGAAPGSFEQSLITTVNNIEVTAAMTYGQTLVIAGGNTTTETRSASGVPVLRKVPVVQNAFSRKTEVARENSLVVLLMLRRPSTPQDRWSADGPFGDADPEALAALKARYEGWFNQPASLSSTFGRISREVHGSVFRVGDVRLANPAATADGMMNGATRNRFLEDVTTLFYY